MLEDIVEPVLDAIERHWQRIESIQQSGAVAGSDFRVASAKICRAEIEKIVTPEYIAIVAPGKTAAAKIKALAAAHKHLVVDLIRPRLTNEGSQTIALEGANQASQAVYLSIIASDTDPKSLIAGFQKATL